MRISGKTVVLLPVALALLGLVSAVQSGDSPAVSPQEVKAVLTKAINYLKSTQGQDGSFAPRVAGPGVSALVAAGLLKNGVSTQEPVLAKTLSYLEKQVKADGGIYNKILANYTTSVAVMAFKEADQDGKYDSILKNAARFLKGLQYDERNTEARDVRFGGFGYDGKSPPDMSNSAFSVEALLAAGLSKDDPAVKKALQFISRCQNLAGEFNDQPFAKKAAKDDEGGFVYRPDPDDKRHQTPEGGLRSLGSMTYGGLKSFLYAGVNKDDPRVKAAVSWIRMHYTLNENPGMGKAGLYYYYHTFAKAMTVLGEDPFVDAAGQKHYWRRELFDALKSRQSADGSWHNKGDKMFGEANPDLATAFAVLTLHYCQAGKR
jgi:squalene-hopene/tetraprenyl-beta-curcumene cyclase